MAKATKQGLIARKRGMTQIFGEDGNVTPVTVLEAGPCTVVQVKTRASDGYEALQFGFEPKRKNVTKPMAGHFKKADVPPCRVLRELHVEGKDEVKVGDKISVDQFAAGDMIVVVGTSKGKGFQGVVKRHHFRGGAATHGSMFHRAPGSIGASAFPSRVIPGMRAAGHMGSERITQKGLEVVRVDADNNILVVKGSVPGGGGGYLVIRKG